MAPELIKRQPTDQRIDVFSYAVTCFELYTKRHPWDAAMTIDAVLQHINIPPINIKTLVPRIDSQIAETIMRGLNANPADRWQTVSDMVDEFRQVEKRLVAANHEAKLLEKQAAVAKVEAKKAAAPTPKKKSKVAAKKQGTKTRQVIKNPTTDEIASPGEKNTKVKTSVTKSQIPDEPDFFGDSDEILALPDTSTSDSSEFKATSDDGPLVD